MPTRAHYRDVMTSVRSGQLSTIPGASVFIFKPGTTTQLTTIYQASSGGTTYTQPLSSDTNGIIEFWLDGEQNVDLNISATGFVTQTVTVTVSSPDTQVPSNTANPGFQVDESAGAAATGLKITSSASGFGVSLTAISPSTDENLTITAKGNGLIIFGQNTFVTGGAFACDILEQNTASTFTSTIFVNYQAIAFGQYTINGGTLTISGEFRIGPWPF